MSLDDNTISQFAKLTTTKESRVAEATVYGEIVEQDGEYLLMIDGADGSTPISTTAKVKAGERVVATIKNHEAVVIGNQSNPAIGAFELDEFGNLIIKQCVTFKGLADGTTTIDGACIKTGTIDAERLNLTGAITWSNLASDAQQEISDAQTAASAAQSTANNAQSLASSAQSSASSAQSLASSAYNLAYSNTLPSYIKSTYIDGTQVSSSVIRGGVIGGARFSQFSGDNLGGNWCRCSLTIERGLRVLAV